MFQTASTRGLGFKIVVACNNCGNEYIPSCSFVGHSYEINRRFIFVMRILGIGYEGLCKFCGLMDMPSFLDKSTHTILLKQILNCSKTVAETFMMKAVNEEKQAMPTTENEDINHLTVSGDGTWQKRGYTSSFGVSSIIGYFTGKILDINIKSAYCKLCEYWKKKQILLTSRNGINRMKMCVLLIIKGLLGKWRWMRWSKCFRILKLNMELSMPTILVMVTPRPIQEL